MTENLGRTPPRRTAFVAHSQLLSADDVARALRRMAHEVLERNSGREPIVVIGLQTGGVTLARALAVLLGEIGDVAIDVGTLDVAFFRDDLSERPILDATSTSIPVDLSGRVVLLVDDVLFTGRTIRAALNALSEWGRPRSIQLAVLVDRGHRELPIRPDYVGKNLPTALREAIVATLEGVWIGTEETS